VNIIPSVPLGRLRTEQLRPILATLEQCGGELRPAPWRGILLGAVPRAAQSEMLAALRRAELPPDDSNGYAHIIACSGITGCTQSLADVRRDAATLAHLRSSTAKRTPARTIALAACEKLCGMRGAEVALVATPSGYDMRMNGAVVAARLSPEAALSAVSEYL
jgi:sulfite reductase beta subunit-like hemoprotein